MFVPFKHCVVGYTTTGYYRTAQMSKAFMQPVPQTDHAPNTCFNRFHDVYLVHVPFTSFLYHADITRPPSPINCGA